MKKQLIITVNDKFENVIDISDDESISVNVDYPYAEFAKKFDPPPKPSFKVSGLRWRSGDHFQLEWLEDELKLNDKITVQLVEDEKTITQPSKVEKYIEPEASCSFCFKKSSEVKVLVKSKSYVYICDECVLASQKTIDRKLDEK